MTTMRKTFYCYHELDEAIPVMEKLKRFLMPYIELILENNTKNKFPSRFKGYADMNPHLLSEDYHQIILDKIEGTENLNHEDYILDENYYNVDIDDTDDEDN